jgi:mannitol/fructose-specific phosphotransferase system IIA component (Ntr-type)
MTEEEFNEIGFEEETGVIFAEEAYRQYLRFLTNVADKLIKEDIRERTQVNDEEVAVLAMLAAIIQNKDMKNYLPVFSDFLAKFLDNYLHLAISRKRKSRAEIIEAIKSAFRAVEEKTRKSVMQKLLRE